MHWTLILIFAGLLAFLAYGLFWGFGLGRIYWWNIKQLKANRAKAGNPEIDETEKRVLQAIRSVCEPLQCKWILTEKDLNLKENTSYLINSVAASWHPESSFPLTEATLGRLLDAFQELHCRMIRLTQFQGLYAATQFRLRHIFFLNQAWKKKQTLEATPPVRFIRKFHIDFLVRWVYTAFRFFDISFWAIKMASYFLYDVCLKTLFIHWYLMVGELADGVYRHGDGTGDIDSESILEAMKDLPEPSNPESESWPQPIRAIFQNSRQKILFSWGTLNWEDIQEIYNQLVRNIAKYHFPDSKVPIYEATIFSLLTSATHLAKQAASLKSQPLVQKLFNIRISNLIFLKNVADWVSDKQVFELIRKHELQRMTRYASLLFKTIRRRHPGLLFKELAWFLIQEGLKRWSFLQLHQKIAIEAQRVFSESNHKFLNSEKI